ncbi:gas vesicle protein K [Dactylosporangium roseum]|uniref:Gas vesicle protein K n=1 Tax=Dactylosporangium roseum TaxID=47989 RepID=A0ABY5ZEC5_9ACTN|nr:gas vesicle protein K [Dactylosporangium roseum]
MARRRCVARSVLVREHERLRLDRDTVEQDFATLVLTVVELLRQLVERQAVRRVDEGDLTDEQVERIGLTLMALDDRMGELLEHFQIRREDLNIDLGPLGPLLPRD